MLIIGGIDVANMYSITAQFNQKEYYLCSVGDEPAIKNICAIYRQIYPEARYVVSENYIKLLNQNQYLNCLEFIRDYKAKTFKGAVILDV